MRYFPFSFPAGALAALAFLCSSMLPASASAPEGTWVRHHTFDHQLACLAPAPGRLYILMHPMEYRNNVSADVGTPAARPFVIKAGSSSMYPLSDEIKLSGEAVRVMRYNPVAGYLLLAYENGEIDLVFSDGRKREVTALSMNSFPGLRSFHEATFSPDGRKAYVASDFGYVLVGADSSSDRVVQLGGPLKCVAEAGSDLLAILPDGSAGIARGGAATVDDFKPIRLDAASDSRLVAPDGTMRSPLNILPLSPDAFASVFYLDEGSPILAVVVRRGDAWHAVPMVQDGFRLTPSARALNSMGDNNGIPNRDGYYFHAGNIAYQILRDADFSLPDEELVKNALRIRYKVADNHRDSSSWDFNDFWFYLEYEGFYPRRADSGYEGKTVWLDRGETVCPDFPVAFISDEIVNHPSRGLILQNHGTSLRYPSVLCDIPPMLCGLKGGKWTNYSPSWHKPSFTADDASLASLYESRRLSYPIPYAKGVEVDPDNADFVFSGSMLGGMCRFNLGDPSAPILHMGQPGDKNAAFPGFVPVAETMTSWSAHCNFSTPRFDSEGNLWTLYYNLDAQRAGRNEAEVWVWPKADRMASNEANLDPSSFREWTKLIYPGVLMTNYGCLLPLKSPVNKSLVVVCGNTYAPDIMVIDHQGTLSRNSDDKIATLHDIVDDKGGWVTKDRIYCMREDQSTGMVWVGTDAGLFYFSPASSFYEAGRVMRPVPFDPVKGVSCTLLDGVQIYDIAFDAEGRKWIATHGAGVWCLSADNSRVERQWTTRNSPLPSDVVYAVGCGLEEGNVLVSTERGLAEFVPLGSGRRLPGVGVSVSPARVLPDYEGWIEAKGLPVARAFAVTDASGMVVRELSSPGDGTLRWDALDKEGHRCPTGRYFITPLSDSSDRLAEITLLGI